MNQEEFVIRWTSLFCLAFLLVAATGCAVLQTKSSGGQADTASAGKGGNETPNAAIKQEYLQRKLMGFADTFATKFVGATGTLLEQASGPERAHVARSSFEVIASAFNIASDRYPKVGLVDMVILVTLERIVWEEYWQPEVYGNKARDVTRTLREFEEDVWAMAATVLTPEQLKELRAQIYGFREKNPNLQTVTFIRIASILEYSGLGSTLQKERQPGGLLAPLTVAASAVEEIRFSAERAMYQLSRMQLTLSLQAAVVYHDMANLTEIRQLLSDITGFRETVERLPAQISDERMSIMRDIESQGNTIRKVVGDIREMMKEGNALISQVDGTTKTVDKTAGRIDGILSRPGAGRPFDIMDWYNTVAVTSDTVKQANSLLDSVDSLLASPNWRQQLPVVIQITDGVASQSKGVITHAVLMVGALLLFFCVTFFSALLAFRYASKRLLG